MTIQKERSFTVLLCYNGAQTVDMNPEYTSILEGVYNSQ